jgi:hypothetical protein
VVRRDNYRAARGEVFVSSFVSRRFQSHVFSTVVSNLTESSAMLKTGQK